MKKTLSLLFLINIFLLTSISANAQYGAKQNYKSPRLAVEIARHRKVAIIPFFVKITYQKTPKDFSTEATHRLQSSFSKSIQASMYSYLLRKTAGYSVSIQNADTTNLLLEKAGMLADMDAYTKEELAKVLNVDAIIGGRFEHELRKPEGFTANVADFLLWGMGAEPGSAKLFLSLNNGADGELLWRFFNRIEQRVSSTDDMIEKMMRKVSRAFPYH